MISLYLALLAAPAIRSISDCWIWVVNPVTIWS